MIRVLSSVKVDSGICYRRIAGTSADAKPTTGIATGSTFDEADTGKRYTYDEKSGTWIEGGEQG